ncbi:MAG: leucine-rich repeat domain-containing protein [Acidimicrobiia bacterium]|nr:leucine-rich repeat domain-containing protein [Acidimicrobiia bacterium]
MNVFNGLSSLQTLDLSDNSLASLPADAFNGLPSLESLSLDNNSLSGFPTRAFRDLGALVNLSMGQNRLTCLTSAMAQRKSILTVTDLIGVSPKDPQTPHRS